MVIFPGVRSVYDVTRVASYIDKSVTSSNVHFRRQTQVYDISKQRRLHFNVTAAHIDIKMEEGNFNLSNLNVVAGQIASEIEKEQTKVSQTDEPQQQSGDIRLSSDGDKTANTDFAESLDGKVISNSFNVIDTENQNYDPTLDEELKKLQFVKPTLNERPSLGETSDTSYQEVELSEDYCNSYVASMRLVINPDSDSSDDSDVQDDSKVDNGQAGLTKCVEKDNECVNEKEEKTGDEKAVAKNEAENNNLGKTEEKLKENQEKTNAVFEQSIYSGDLQNVQTHSACTGQYLQSGATCYVYQQVPENIVPDASGNLVYFQMPCEGQQYSNGSYYYVHVPNGYYITLTEDPGYQQTTDGAVADTHTTTDKAEASGLSREENTAETVSTATNPKTLPEGNENAENTEEGENQPNTRNSATDSSVFSHNDIWSFEDQYPYNQCEGSDAGEIPFNPYQTLQQPLFAADIYHPYMEPVRLNTNFQYPAVYVSQYGLITVLLKHDVSVEMTVDKAIRLVSHQKNLVVASNSTGDTNFIVHPAGKISHTAHDVEADIYLNRRLKMSDDKIVFGNANQSYKFNADKIEREDHPDFSRLSKNSSVSILFSSNNSSDQNLVMKCLDLIANAHYEPLRHMSGGYMVKINNIKVIQTYKGDVKVISPGKVMRLSPRGEDLHLRSKHFIEIGIESDWGVWINHGQNFLRANRLGFILCNSFIEAGFDANDCIRACRVPSGIPIHVESSKRRYVPRAQKKSTRELE